MLIGLVLVSGVLFVALVGLLVVTLRRRPPAPPPAPAPLPPVKQTMDDVRALARAGRKADAIRLFRLLTGHGLVEARTVVDQMAGARPPASTRRQGIILREVHDADIESQIRSGHLLNAIQLYREKTGVGPQEARNAVQRWRDRLRAS